MLRTLMVCLALGLAAAVPTDKDTLNILFSKFVKEHGKVYNTREEMIHRQKIFAENLQKIEQHNRAGASYKMGKAYRQSLIFSLKKQTWTYDSQGIVG